MSAPTASARLPAHVRRDPPAAFRCRQAAAPSAPAATTASAATAWGLRRLGPDGPSRGRGRRRRSRRRAIRRGSGLLDRLDELKLALLNGDADEGALDRLARSLREERADDDDQDLNALLDQIDLRASVELAKAEMRRNRP
ncbi:MAG: flagellar assembly protein FliX [Stenotrophomonas sp.]